MINMIGNWFGTGALADIGDALNNATQFVFFKTINDFLRNEIDILQWNLLSRSASIIGFVAIVLLTIWIMFQGYRIVTGQSRQPMMALVGDSLRAVLVIFLATSVAYSSSPLYWTLTDGLSSTIATYVTGSSTSPFQSIDNNLAGMEGALSIIDAIDTGGNSAADAAKDRDRWFTGVGIAGPSVIAGALLLLNKIALALFIGFGPIFIMCLLFDQTKGLFSKWLFYGIGTMFSLALLSVMVTIAMNMMSAVTAAFAAKYLASMASGTTTDGISSMALQQGGLGLILSTLIVMAPPMAAAFFQGTLGQFASYSSFGTIGARGPMAHQQQALAQGRTPTAYAPTPIDHSRESGRSQLTDGRPSLPMQAATLAQKDEIRSGSDRPS
ncbi:type IV secretion system protein VirB6 [Dyella jiangningensis]|uniref:type IV secretion system protein n=1 Tax=Dyella sp. AtDHG13 TaxID=1938897 RepID=UPI00088E6E39|nr:type IV secretion system protein [Dyella sp. AtDHG13]PXV59809.1 type IV secretion system protein VirB6 [Dyella sp. AtDHG13]SDJ21753.1 type IV secretion system protein VirB6 [Dyella jiangningensis]